MITKVKISGYRIFKCFEFRPHHNLNLIVGANESGKSTLLEAIVLGLTGRINGRRASEELNPYWFNTEMVDQFVSDRREGKNVTPPEIKIELFFEDRVDLQQLCGAVNSEVPTMACPGTSLKITPNPEYREDFEKWMENPSDVLPVEYYMEDWRDFADNRLTQRPRQLVTAVIDSRTVRSTHGVDYHLRNILSDHLNSADRAAVSLEYRRLKLSVSDGALKDINARMSGSKASLHDKEISLAMDQSARTSWETAITPHVDRVPFSMSGQGQQAAIKISLAMDRHSDRANFVMVEEPENHLSHTSLNTLISRMGHLAGVQQQLFITTHSSFVLNRLGLSSLLLLGSGTVSRIPDLSEETVAYFQKLPGYDTLRLALAEKIVLVEGASDEIIFERVFIDLFAKRPIEAGIDVISMRGLSARRALELCTTLDKPVAAIRDNDGFELDELREPLKEYLAEGKRELFVSKFEHGKTLEPQLVKFNGEEKIRRMLSVTAQADLSKWMEREKTEVALQILSSKETLTPPDYLKEAAEFIHG